MRDESSLVGVGMKLQQLSVVLLVAVVVVGARVYAHHSFAATYHNDEVTTIEGEVVQFLYRNPHSFLHVMAPDPEQQVHRWAAEWSAGGRLSREGVQRDTLRPGDHIIVTGNPGRNPEDHRLRVREIVRPSDGWKWSGVVE